VMDERGVINQIKHSDGLLLQADNLACMRTMPSDSVDLIFGSPPYENARTYRELDFKLEGQDWVDWMMERWREFSRISKGLVAMVMEGRTFEGKYTCTPALLMADLHRAGFHVRKPPIYKRFGVPGSGGPEWLRNDYEWIVCTSKGKLPWSENTACGGAPKYLPGGLMCNRTETGERVKQKFKQPDVANPGNIIDCGSAGGGHQGCDIAHEGDAPFPERLAEFFVRSFCPPGGIVMDPFSGTGTTVSVARQWGRKWIGIDLRASEIEKSDRRLKNGALRASTLEGVASS
jgi:hypothetical protein